MKLSKKGIKTEKNYAPSLTNTRRKRRIVTNGTESRRVAGCIQGWGDQAPEGALQCESEQVVTRCTGNDEP